MRRAAAVARELVERDVVLRLVGAGVALTLGVNLIALVSPLFFMQVYDRVLTTGSIPTLIALMLAALIAIAIGAAFEQWRSVIFQRLGAQLHVDLEQPVFRAAHASAARGGQGQRSRPLDDLETVRSVVSGPLPASLLDLVFAPVLLLILFLINVWLGVFALSVLLAMCGITALSQWLIARSLQKSGEAQQAAAGLAESHMRAAEAAHAMGYADRAFGRWAQRSREAVKLQIDSAARAGGLTAAGRGVRSGAQIVLIALAAGLAIGGAVSPGAIIASSILFGRLLAPVDSLLGGWRQLARARLAADRLAVMLEEAPRPGTTGIQRPEGQLQVASLFASTPEGAPILRGVSFTLGAGESLAVLGPTGAGKSTLLRCVMGVWPDTQGMVRLDGVPLAQADRTAIGAHIGFLPQATDLAPGTIAQNIARFADADMEIVRAAAQAAGAHQAIMALPKGYETEVGEVGARLSAGQRRRIALARALFGEPRLVCLDEPEAHLDRDGEVALANALQALRASGATVLIAAHRPSVVAQVDKVLVLKDGAVAQFGSAADVLPMLSGGNIRKVSP